MTCDVNKRDKLFPKSVIAKDCFHTNENNIGTLPMEIPPTTSDWVKSTSVKCDGGQFYPSLTRGRRQTPLPCVWRLSGEITLMVTNL